MRGPFGYEKIKDYFRVHDSADNRIATCWLEENAVTLVRMLNDGGPQAFEDEIKVRRKPKPKAPGFYETLAWSMIHQAETLELRRTKGGIGSRFLFNLDLAAVISSTIRRLDEEKDPSND